jgi:glycosyl transferase, family 25
VALISCQDVNNLGLLNASSWPILIVSLEDAVERRSPLESALRQLGLEYSLIPAVDGRSGLPSEYDRFVDRELAKRNLGRSMTETEFACALSHLKVYEAIQRSGIPGAVVLEDDAVIGELFRDLYSSRVFQFYDFLQWDYGIARFWKFGLGRRKLTDHICAERLLFNAPLTTGYSLSRRAAKFLSANALPVCLPADWPCDLKPLKPLATFPRVVGRPPDDSGSHLARARKDARERADLAGRAEKEARNSSRPIRERNPMPKAFRYITRPLSVHIPRNDVR